MKQSNVNYQKCLEEIIEKMPDKKRLLLHSCCAPCSSYVLEYLSKYFEITVFYYNPNITIAEEYEKRTAEIKRLVEEMNRDYNVTIACVEGDYEPQLFFQEVRGLEHCKEGGERCRRCFEIRLDKSALYAASHGFDYFTTTLTISPLKNAPLLNEIGEAMGERYGISFLPSDFKKKNGYKRSIELSKQYELYRQDYCGCIYSKRDRLAEENAERS